MLLGLGLGLIALAAASDSNDAKRELAQRENERIRIERENAEQGRRHETTMAIVNGVFDLMRICAANNNENEQ